MVEEPVRGRLPDPSFWSLPGIDQARARLRGIVPRSPLSHLIGLRLTQVGAGSATVTMPATPWLQNYDGAVDTRILLDRNGSPALLLSVVRFSASADGPEPATLRSRGQFFFERVGGSWKIVSFHVTRVDAPTEAA